MKYIIKLRWAIIAAWIAAAVLLTMFTPDLQQLVAEKGQITVPDEYRSNQAGELLDKMSDSDIPLHDLVLVFHDDGGLNQSDKEAISKVIETLNAEKEALEIDAVLDFTENEEIAESTVSGDNTTILVPIEAATENQSVFELRNEINQIASTIDVKHALTGESLIEEDIITNSEEGLTKTVYITVALILIILFVVFKSFIAPIIPLLTVGISYLVAEGLVSILADTTSFPLSTFTQIFMVSIMFGIGTDYCILIISRFKEEMNEHDSMKDAVIATYKASGMTVFYAALAVLIGFSTIGLSQFTLYQSAVAVAVGVFVITVAIMTIIPFFLVLLGKRLFWPFDKKAQHEESKLWGALGHFTWTRPVLSIMIILIVTVPALLFFKNAQSYDNLAELNDAYDTVQGFNWIEDSFGPGEIMPITVVMKLDDEVDQVSEVQGLETITDYIADIDGIKKVRSVSRPSGEIVDDFLLETQTDVLSDGLDEMMDGLTELEDGLTEAADEMKGQAPALQDAQDGVQALMDGTNEAKDGITEIQSYLTEIEQGLLEGSTGANEAVDGLRTIKSNLDETIAGHKEVLAGYEQLAAGLQQAEKDMQESANIDIDFDIESMIQALDGIKQSIDGMDAVVGGVEADIQQIPDYQAAYGSAIGMIEEMKTGMQEAGKQLAKLENVEVSLKELIDPFEELNVGYREIIKGQEQLAIGIQDLINGLTQLSKGLTEAANGQSEIVNSMPPLADGLGEIHDGQQEMKDAFQELQDGLDELADGLSEGSEGFEEVHDGLDDMNRYLTEMDFTSQTEIVIIPKEALEEEDFWEGADLYLSPDRKIVKFDAILDVNPYTVEAIHLVDEVHEQVNHAIDKTRLEVNDVQIAGTSSMNNDLNDVSAKDYQRTATLMLIGIFIVLVFLLRSLVMPIYILASLLLTYYTSLSVTEFIYVTIIGQDGLTWAIPFFSFVMLIALGVDYSIFLMSRFNEYKHQRLYDGMMKSMRNMGTVIISATIILGGTFAAMLPSGVLSLLQIATVVIIGLALYALVILPLFTPICVKLFGQYNWWPFQEKKKE